MRFWVIEGGEILVLGGGGRKTWGGTIVQGQGRREKNLRKERKDGKPWAGTRYKGSGIHAVQIRGDEMQVQRGAWRAAELGVNH